MGGVSVKLIIALFVITGIPFMAGCTVDRFMKSIVMESPDSNNPLSMKQEEKLYEQFFNIVVDTGKARSGRGGTLALKQLPRDAYGAVNWTTAVMQDLLAPRGSLDHNAEEEAPLNLNIFIEAKVPLMANVVFPHSIHTYWLSCNNCHPKIFLPEVGANPITMDEIFAGEWCGRCHGKVAFDFWPEANCRRCHMVPKKMSGRHENF